MVAPKSREVLAIHRSADGDSIQGVEVRDADGNRIIVAPDDLRNGEAVTVLGKVYPTVPRGKPWFTTPLLVRIGLLKNVVSDAEAGRVQRAYRDGKDRTPDPKSTPAPKAVPVVPNTDGCAPPAEAPAEASPAPAPVFAPTAAASLAAALEAALAGAVNEERVRAIVKDEVTSALEASPVVTIEVRRPDGGVERLPDQHHELLPTIVKVAARRRHLFLVGPAGSGKSTLAVQAAHALGLPLYSISFGPTTPTSKLFGFIDAAGNFRETPFYRCYSGGGVMLADELDNGHPGLTAELNQALANEQAAFACGMVERHPDFVFIATGNTYGRGGDRMFVGRNQLDAATLDRFAMTLALDYDERLESALVRAQIPADASPDERQGVEAWLAEVRRVRQAALDNKLQVLATPRAAIEGTDLLLGGVPVEVLREGKLFAGVGEEVRRKLGA